MSIIYKTVDRTAIDEIKELWGELNGLHLSKSPYFKRHYKDLTFKERKDAVLSHVKNGKINIIIAFDGDKKIGYCIASVVKSVGEIDSIYIKPEYRKNNVGDNLIQKAIDFIKSNDVKKIIVRVAYGNEEVFGFYSKYGFKPRATTLEMIPLIPGRGSKNNL